jgi:hypothetical protein
VTAQRLSRIAAGIAIVTVLGVTALVTRNVLWPDDPDASLQHNGGKVMGDMAGFVGRVDREARTVDISTSPLGIRPVVLLVTNDTAIVVNGKQGAIGDLWKDLPVRVLYEVRDNTRYATSIQVTAGDSLAATPGTAASPGTREPATPAPASLPVPDRPAAAAGTKETKAPSEATSPAPVAPPAPPMPTAPPSSPKPAAPASVATKPAPVAPPPAAVALPSKPVAQPPAAVAQPPAAVAQPPAAVAQPPAPRVAEPPAPRVPATAATSGASAESASVDSSRAARPAPAESDADGSAAIDWLLKEGGRR